MAWHLARQGLRFVVLDAAPEIGHTWRSRWDSLTLFTPAQYDALPGMPFPARRHLPDQGPGRRLPAGLRRRLRPAGPAQRPGHRPEPRSPRASRSAPTTRSSAPGRWWWRPGRSRCPSSPPAAQRLDASVTQLHSAGLPQPAGPAGRAGAGRRRRQLRLPDRRGARRQPPGRPVDRQPRAPMLPQRLAGKDLFWWLTRLGLMRVTAGSRLGRRMSSRGVHHRQQPPPAPAGRRQVPAPADRRRRAHRPVRRRQHPGRRTW